MPILIKENTRKRDTGNTSKSEKTSTMSTEDILLQLKETYLATLPNRIEEMEAKILAMEEGHAYRDNFESLYRNVHSLKGSGGTYGFNIITSICHQMEDYISEALSDANNIATLAFDNIFKYIDILKDTQVLLLTNSENFQGIEARLKDLKGNVQDHKINGMFVGQANNMYSQICIQVFDEAHIHCTIVDSALGALQRSLHEHFDFIVTSKENIDLSGPALIAALKLNSRKGDKLKTIMTTSNPGHNTCEELKPDFIVLKNKSFDANLLKAIEEIKKSHK